MPYKHRKSIYYDDENIRDLVFKGYTIVYMIEVYARISFGHPAHSYLASSRINTWPPHASIIWPAK